MPTASTSSADGFRFDEASGFSHLIDPLDHLALGHRRLDDRYYLVEPVLGDDEAADMLGEMTGTPENLVGEVDHMK